MMLSCSLPRRQHRGPSLTRASEPLKSLWSVGLRLDGQCYYGQALK